MRITVAPTLLAEVDQVEFMRTIDAYWIIREAPL